MIASATFFQMTKLRKKLFDLMWQKKTFLIQKSVHACISYSVLSHGKGVVDGIRGHVVASAHAKVISLGRDQVTVQERSKFVYRVTIEFR